MECGEVEWSAEYGVIHFGRKSVIFFDIRQFAQIKYNLKNRLKNGQNENKVGRFWIILIFKKGKVFDPPPKIVIFHIK